MIILGEDYGEGASVIQERSHAFAMKSSMWLLDPRPNLTSIVDLVEKGFELSEASNSPVMMQLRIRTCHVYGRFDAKDNREGKYLAQRSDAEAGILHDASATAGLHRPAGAAEDRPALPGGEEIHRRQQAQRVFPR